MDHEIYKSRVGRPMGVRTERESLLQIYSRTHPQGPPLTPRPEEMAKRTAYPNANGENWLERSPMEKEGSGI
jgi:hypothetical protein